MLCQHKDSCFNHPERCGDCRANSDIYNHYPLLQTRDLVEVVRCKDCVHSIPLDKHCEINNSAYKHCGIHRGDDVRNVWHKYKKYYKHYSIVHLDDFCSEGVRKEGAESG